MAQLRDMIRDDSVHEVKGAIEVSVWKTFMQVLLAGATLMGFYVGAVAGKALWLFWVIVLAAIVAAVLRSYGSLLREVMVRYRKHPQLLLAAAINQKRVMQFEQDLTEARADAVVRYMDGVEEGQAMTLGSLLAVDSGARLEPIAVSFDLGSLVMHAKVVDGSRPQNGARFALAVAATAEVKGVMQVSADERRGLLGLECVERTVEAFWDRLEKNAASQPNPPSGLTLIPAGLTPGTIANQLEFPQEGQ